MLIFAVIVVVFIFIPFLLIKLPAHIGPKNRNKILAHIMFCACDLGSVYALWLGYNEVKEIMIGIQTQADTIRVFSRIGFYITGLFMILVHFFGIIVTFKPSIEKKYEQQITKGCIAGIIAMFAIGFGGSAVMKNQVENAGYVYCRNASGISALARTLVYTKTMAICEQETQKKALKSASASDLRQ